MGYFTRSEIPFQYSLADAFTICDGYHGDHGPDQPQPDVLLQRHVVRLDFQPERLQGRLRLRRQDGRGHHVPGAAAGGRGELVVYPTTRSATAAATRTTSWATTATTRYRSTSSTTPPTAPRRDRHAGDPRGGHQVADRQGSARAQPDARRLRAVVVINAVQNNTLPQVSWIVAPAG